MKKTVVIALSNQKGGVGKSTVATNLASYLHYVMGKEIAVLDCDTGQHSLVNLREREKLTIEKVDAYKEMMMLQWEKNPKKAYPIVASSPMKVNRDINELLASERHFDLIIVDLPGTVSAEGVLTAVVNVDYVMTPIVADRFDMQSTLGFATAVMDFKRSRGDGIPLKEFIFFWNRVDRRVSTEIFDSYNKIMERLNFYVLDTILPNLSRFGRELSYSGKPFFRCTLMPPMPKLLEESNLDLLAKELCEYIKI